jgi:pimeloyl-ACP methyl ester carboxylesterase
LHVTTLGDGPAVFLLHDLALGAGQHEWRYLAPALATRARVVAVDLPGFGRSDAPDGPFTPETLLAGGRRALDEAVAEECVLVASGQSSAYALELARRHPEAFRAIVLSAVRGPLTAGEQRPGLARRLAAGPLAGALVNLLARPTLVSWRLRFGGRAAGSGALHRNTVLWYSRSARHPASRQLWRALVGGGLDLPVDGAITGLRVPVLVLCGDRAPAWARRRAEEWVEKIPGARGRLVQGAGSHPHLERPDQTLTAILNLLERP